MRFGCFVGKVCHFRHGKLHFRGQRVAFDACRERIAAAAFGQVAIVEPREQVSAGSFRALIDGPRGEQIADRRTLRVEHYALVPRGEKAVCPVDRSAGGQTARVGQNDIGRQFVGVVAESIGQPRAGRGKAVEAKAGVLLKRGRRVARRFGHHRANHG